MQKVLFQINNTSPSPTIYMETRLQGDGCSQLFIRILLADGALLWATVADPEVEAPLSHRGLLSSLPTGM